MVVIGNVCVPSFLKRQVHLPLTPEQLKVFQDSAGLRAAANSCSRSGNGVHSEDHLKACTL
jgi:hypothetical protein